MGVGGLAGAREGVRIMHGWRRLRQCEREKEKIIR